VATKFDAAKFGFDLTENLYLDISDIVLKPSKATEKQKKWTRLFSSALNAVAEFTLEIIKCYPWCGGKIGFQTIQEILSKSLVKIPKSQSDIERVKMFSPAPNPRLCLWWQNLTL
jgi:hypothetical protein